jgi:hypothetical protein
MTFEESEKAVDKPFFKLPQHAQGIALDIISLCKNSTNPERCIVRELDSSHAFRDAIGVTDLNVLPQETDAVLRYYAWYYK